jgi:lysophospholipase L1-like esterase
LEKAVNTLKTKNPKAKIVFVATIAPSKQDYGLGQVDLAPDVRKQWAEERIAYMQNHIAFAKSHGIPVIDILTASLNQSGDANLDYISKDDYIHPSPNGIVFISKQMADFIYQNKLLN